MHFHFENALMDDSVSGVRANEEQAKFTFAACSECSVSKLVCSRPAFTHSSTTGQEAAPPAAQPAPLSFSPDSPWLAPLAGYSDLAFRLLCREYGASVCCTEMISARGLLHNNPGTRELLRTTPEDAPLVVQLFADEAESVSRAMHKLLEAGFVYFDLNMGCAVPKVTRSGCGAAMLKNLPNALKTARAMIALAAPGCVGFKMRLGWDAENPVWEQLAPALADSGAGWLSLHPRTARQGFGGTADWSVFARLAPRLSIPLVASGDLLCAADGLRCLREFGPSCVMYARGALRNPAIFAEHRSLLANAAPRALTAKELRACIERHAALARACGRRGERGALLQMRSIVPRYVHHLPGVRHLRQSLCQCGDWTEFTRLLDDFFGAF